MQNNSFKSKRITGISIILLLLLIFIASQYILYIGTVNDYNTVEKEFKNNTGMMNDYRKIK